MTKNPLKISQISKSFEEKLILDDINFEVKQNHIFGFVGLNGVGKTSLIKIILDLLSQDFGDVEIFGINKNLPKSRQKICYLPEKFYPAQNLTGREFIKFSLGFYEQKIDEKELLKYCEHFELNIDFLDKKIAKYSKGMVQKLGLIAVFLTKSDLIILDEPMSGLDVKARVKLKRALLSYKNQDKTIFFSSHILSDIDEICDEIAVLNNAKISFLGTSQGLKNKHRKDNLEEAFLQEIN